AFTPAPIFSLASGGFFLHLARRSLHACNSSGDLNRALALALIKSLVSSLTTSLLRLALNAALRSGVHASRIFCFASSDNGLPILLATPLAIT
ncbi:hypothetical protein, partial [Klebsiella pneumoniae]|uniref:hypothetical protein n=1 Tax=Klebsiella pneumoniae TaxID=573 RepID=UPI001D0E3E50